MARKITYAEDVDQAKALQVLHDCGTTHDLSETFNVRCALHNINLFVSESEDNPGVWVITNHDYTHANKKIQLVIEHIRQTLLDPELPNYVSRGVYSEVLGDICDTFNFAGYSTLRELVEDINTKAIEAARDQWNAGMHAYSQLNKFIESIADESDTQSWEKLLAGVLRLCVGYDKITLDKAYQDACMALTGKPELDT